MARTKLPSVASTVEPVVATTPLARVNVKQRSELSEDGQAAAAYEGLPALLVEFAEVAGLHAALAIAEARGGNRIFIPRVAGDDHWLVQLVGRDAADKLCSHFTTSKGEGFDVPRGPTGLRASVWRRLYQMMEDGSSSSEITRRLGISRDTVKYHRAKLRHQIATRQLNMFALLETDEAE